MRKFLPALVKMPNFKDSVRSVGLVRDAEESEARALQSVQSSLKKVGLPAPAQAGVNTASDHPKVGIMILPGNGQPGMLETLVNRTFSGAPIENCINGSLDCAVKSAAKQLRSQDKARSFAFLAVSPDAHHSIGVAAKQDVVDLEHEAFSEARDFLSWL